MTTFGFYLILIPYINLWKITDNNGDGHGTPRYLFLLLRPQRGR